MKESLDRLARFIEAQRGEYLRALPDKVAQAETLWTQKSPEALESLQRLAHTVYGTAGTYKFAEVGEAARVLEEAVKALREGPASPERTSQVDAAVRAFRASLPPAPPQESSG